LFIPKSPIEAVENQPAHNGQSTILNLRAMEELNNRLGSSFRWIARKDSSLGYMTAKSSARSTASFAR
jgi:hypothetical protein